MSFFEPKNHKNQGLPAKDQNNEHGGALIWVLIMVALFATLSYVVSQGSRGGVSQISDQQAKLAATEILDYARQIKNAVQQLQINGCSDTEVSFDQAFVSGYSNPNAPTDNSCHVYHPNGGGMRYQAVSEDWLDSSNSTENFYGEWFTTPSIWLVGLGTDGFGANCNGGISDGSCRELITGVPYLRYEICQALNQKLNWGKNDQGDPIEENGASYGASYHSRFIGAYGSGQQMGTATPVGDSYSSITNGCIEGGTAPVTGTYHFFQVLIAR